MLDLLYQETLKILGVSNWLHWCAWFVKYLLFLLVSVTLMTLFFCLPISRYGSVVGHTDPSIIFVFLLAYSVATISLAFLVSVFFSRGGAHSLQLLLLWFSFWRYVQLKLCVLVFVQCSAATLRVQSFNCHLRTVTD